mgnify:CR=1 FL=1
MQIPDNVRRGLRTAIQAIAALILTGTLDQYVIQALNDAGVESDSLIRTAWFLVSMFLSTWVMNYAEDKTGVSVLAPKDRVIGDRAIGSGLGEKNITAGSTSPG